MAFGIKEVNFPKPVKDIQKKQKAPGSDVNEIVEEILKQVRPTRKLDSKVISEMVNQVIKKYQMI